MRKIRFFWWLLVAFLTKHKKIILAASFIGIIASSTAPRLLQIIPRRFHVRTIGLVGSFKQNDLPEIIIEKIGNGLTKIDNTGQVIPDLASEWSISDDGKVYIFKLDRSRKWSDGTQVFAKDVHLSIESVEKETIDDQTIKFSLKEPFAPFPAVLSKPIFKPGMIGTGPYILTKLKKNGDFIILLSITNPINHDTITYKFYRTTQEVVTALKLGEINEIDGLASTKDIPDWKEFEVIPKLNLDRYIAIFFNTKDNQLSEKSFRQALAYAIPNKPQGPERAISPVNPNSWGYNPQVKLYNSDPNQAKELIKSIYDDQEYPSLELVTFLPYLNLAEDIARAWTDLGVKTSVKVATEAPTEFQVLLIGQQISPDPDQYILWHSTQPTNITGYSSPKVDKLLEDGRKEIDQNKRKDIYRDFQRFLVEDTPAIFLEHITTYTVRRR